MSWSDICLKASVGFTTFPSHCCGDDRSCCQEEASIILNPWAMMRKALPCQSALAVYCRWEINLCAVNTSWNSLLLQLNLTCPDWYTLTPTLDCKLQFQHWFVDLGLLKFLLHFNLSGLQFSHFWSEGFGSDFSNGIFQLQHSVILRKLVLPPNC